MTGQRWFRQPLLGALVAGLVWLPFASCGGNSTTGPRSSRTTLTVFAAASLRTVFPEIAKRFSNHVDGTTSFRFSFGGTDSLVTQIEQGAPADVFAGASTKYADQLVREGLVGASHPFATNALVVILPASNPAHIASLNDLARPGIKLVIGGETVPVGSYTRTVLKNLDASMGNGFSGKVLANVVSNEDSVGGVLTKVRLGEADAGFVYVTDAKAAGSAVRTLELPPAAEAIATYPIAVLKTSPNSSASARFLTFVLSPDGQQLLREAGFGPPPTG